MEKTVDMCTDMGIDMGIEMRTDMCIGMCTGMSIDMCVVKRTYAQSADALDSRGGSVGINVHTSTAMWHNAIMYCESFHNSSHDCLLASTQCSTSCTLLARPCPVMLP